MERGNERKMLARLVNMAALYQRQERFVEALVEITFKNPMKALS
jgi:uncharacterized protein YjiS (DUF1127 family)